MTVQFIQGPLTVVFFCGLSGGNPSGGSCRCCLYLLESLKHKTKTVH